MPATANTVAMATPKAPVSALATADFGLELDRRTVLVDVVELLVTAVDVVGDVSGGISNSLDGVVSNVNDVVVVCSGSVVVVDSGVVVDDVGSVNGGTWA